MKNNDEEDEETGRVWGDEDEKEGDEIERILSLVPVPSVYINKCDQPCSLSPRLRPHCSPINPN